jgi:uncharacterized Zn finger protein
MAEVRDLVVEVGSIRAEVGKCTVTLSAPRVPPRIWEAMTRFARGRGTLEDAVTGRVQAVHLEHLMAEDWEEPLIPRPSAIIRTCTCDEDERACSHLVALAFAFADAVDGDPRVLLRWRGCTDDTPAEVAAPALEVARPAGDPWQGGPLPEPGAVRALPAGAVLQRLGPSGISVGLEDLADVLRLAYAELSRAEPGSGLEPGS